MSPFWKLLHLNHHVELPKQEMFLLFTCFCAMPASYLSEILHPCGWSCGHKFCSCFFCCRAVIFGGGAHMKNYHRGIRTFATSLLVCACLLTDPTLIHFEQRACCWLQSDIVASSSSAKARAAGSQCASLPLSFLAAPGSDST